MNPFELDKKLRPKNDDPMVSMEDNLAGTAVEMEQEIKEDESSINREEWVGSYPCMLEMSSRNALRP